MPLDSEQVYGIARIGSATVPLVVGGSSGQSSGSDQKLRLSYIVDRYNTSAKLKTPVLTQRSFDEGDELTVDLQDETIFTGAVESSEDGLGDRVHLTAYDAADKLKGATLTQSFDTASIGTIATAALDAAGVGNYRVNVPNERTSPDFDNERCDKVLERCAKWADGVWFVTVDNEVVLTQDIAGESFDHELEHVIDATPGVTTPPYQSVLVIGTAPASKTGQETMHMLSSEAIIATAGDGSPRYRYEDAGIRTQKLADNVAQNILRELERQRRGGTITIVGEPSIRPWDTVTLPAAQGGGTYLVSGVEHSISSRKGFKTTITVGRAV